MFSVASLNLFEPVQEMIQPIRYAKPNVAPTVVSHDEFEGAEVIHLGLVPAEDFGSGTEVVREVFAVSLPHHAVPTQAVDFIMERYVVGWPIPCRT